MESTTTIRRNVKLHINAEEMLLDINFERLHRQAAIISKQGQDHADSAVEDAAASLGFYLEKLADALTTIVEGTR